ncbi:MAG: translocation/assembly module TamB domain-containing protein [Microcoleaceae cyanobacterium]
MTNSPANNEPSPRRPHRLRRALIWGGIGLGVASVGTWFAAAWFIRNRLAPIVATQLENLLQRPVDVGTIQSPTFTNPTTIRVGPSAIPPTANNPNNATVEGIDIRLSVFPLLFQQIVNVDVDLIGLNAYLEEGKDGSWIRTELKQGDGKSPIQLEYGNINVKADDANVDLQPFTLDNSGELISLDVNKLGVNLKDNNQDIAVNLDTFLSEGGIVDAKVKADLEQEDLQIQVKADQVNLNQVSGLLKDEGVIFEAGEITANLDSRFKDGYQFSSLRGNLNLDEVKADIEDLEKPLRSVDGQLQFSGKRATIKGLTGGLGDVAAEVNGTVTVTTEPEFKLPETELNLDVNILPVEVASLIETAESFQAEPITLPVPISGEVEADFNVTGTIANLQVAAQIATTQPTRIDRVLFDKIATDFTTTTELNDEFELKSDPIITIDRVEINPSFGGSILGAGEIELTGLEELQARQRTTEKEEDELDNPLNPDIEFNLDINQVPADRLLRAYGVQPQFRIGDLSADVEVSGSLAELEADANFSLPSASYPISGEANIANNQLNSTIEIAEGTVEITAAKQQQNFTARIDAGDVALTPLVTLGLPFSGLSDAVKAQIANINLNDGRLNVQADVSGSLDNLNPNNINGDGTVQVSLGERDITANAQLNQGAINGDYNTDALPLNRLLDAGLPFANLDAETAAKIQGLDLRNGTITSQGTVIGNLSNIDNIVASAAVFVNLGNLGGIINAETQLQQGQFQADVNTNSIALNPLIDAGLPFVNLSPEALSQVESLNLQGGSIQARGNIIGDFNNITDASGDVQAQVNLGNFGGVVNAEADINQGNFQANIAANSVALPPLINAGLPIANLSPELEREIQRLDLRNATLQADATARGNLANLTPNGITANVDSTVNLGNQGGIVTATGSAQDGQWQARVEGDQIALSRFSQLVESQTRDAVPSILTQAENLPLLRGLLNTELQASGSLSNFNPAAIEAAANLRLTELPILQQPFESIARWNGEQINIQKAETPQFGTSGTIALELQGNGVPQLGNLNLNVRVSEFDFQSPLAQTLLATLPQELTANDTPPITGVVSFDGLVTGSLPNLNLNGDIILDNFALRELDFEDRLRGDINAQLGGGINLDLAGQQDQIELVLNDQYLPVSFLIQRDEAIAKGRSQGNDLIVDLAQFPLGALGLAPLASQGIGAIKGETSANLVISDLSTLDPNQIDVVGNINVQDPALGYINANLLKTEISYVNGLAEINNGVLQLARLEDGKILPGETEILISATANVEEILAQLQSGVALFSPSDVEPNIDIPPQFTVNIDIPNGQLQEVLATLELYQLSDLSRGIQAPSYAPASAVQPVAVGFASDQFVTLFQQLRRLAEIQALIQLAEAQEEEGISLPPLEAVAGEFTASLAAEGALTSGITATADINNQGDWQWGELTANQFQLDAEFQDNVLRIEPLQLKADETLYDVRGQLDLTTQQPTAQFRAKNISLAAIERYYDIPAVDLEGNFNIEAFVGGSLQNPQATGEFNLLDGVINNEDIEKARGSFSYNQAIFNLGGDFFVAETANNPITYQARIPYRLPFAEVNPSDNELLAKVDIEDEGFKIINVLNPEIDWVDGVGDLELQVTGRLLQKNNGEIDFENSLIVPQGVLELNNAVLEAKSLEQSIVNLGGRAEFNTDEIKIVRNIQGELQGESGTGTFVLAGILPLFAEDRLNPIEPDLTNSLQLALNSLNLNVDGLYDGEAEGNIILTGAALEPNIGGNIDINKAVVTLPGGGGAGGGTGGGGLSAIPIDIDLNRFKISLGDKVRIQSAPVGQLFDAPVLDIGATGEIIVNGDLDSFSDIRPSGVVELTGGSINLYTNRFTLDKGYEQTATFVPEQGLIPNIDVRLITQVTETNRAVNPPSAIFPEEQNIPSPARFGTVRTIRVIATAKGPASQINDIVELSSSPRRTDTQLVALLGGSVIDGVTGDSTLLLANIASAELFGELQRTVTEATGLNQFRLYPARLEENGSSGASALGLGLEVGLDITNNVSASLTRVLANDQPTRLGVNYRVNDNLLLRGETDFRDSSAIRFEYSIQF